MLFEARSSSGRPAGRASWDRASGPGRRGWWSGAHGGGWRCATGRVAACPCRHLGWIFLTWLSRYSVPCSVFSFPTSTAASSWMRILLGQLDRGLHGLAGGLDGGPPDVALHGEFLGAQDVGRQVVLLAELLAERQGHPLGIGSAEDLGQDHERPVLLGEEIGLERIVGQGDRHRLEFLVRRRAGEVVCGVGPAGRSARRAGVAFGRQGRRWRHRHPGGRGHAGRGGSGPRRSRTPGSRTGPSRRIFVFMMGDPSPCGSATPSTGDRAEPRAWDPASCEGPVPNTTSGELAVSDGKRTRPAHSVENAPESSKGPRADQSTSSTISGSDDATWRRARADEAHTMRERGFGGRSRLLQQDVASGLVGVGSVRRSVVLGQRPVGAEALALQLGQLIDPGLGQVEQSGRAGPARRCRPRRCPGPRRGRRRPAGRR